MSSCWSPVRPLSRCCRYFPRKRLETISRSRAACCILPSSSSSYCSSSSSPSAAAASCETSPSCWIPICVSVTGKHLLSALPWRFRFSISILFNSDPPPLFFFYTNTQARTHRKKNHSFQAISCIPAFWRRQYQLGTENLIKAELAWNPSCFQVDNTVCISPVPAAVDNGIITHSLCDDDTNGAAIVIPTRCWIQSALCNLPALFAPTLSPLPSSPSSWCCGGVCRVGRQRSALACLHLGVWSTPPPRPPFTELHRDSSHRCGSVCLSWLRNTSQHAVFFPVCLETTVQR